MSIRTIIPRSRFSVLALCALVAAAACRGGASATRDEAGGAVADDVAESWSPNGLKEVRGIPVERLRATIAARLAGDRPRGLDAKDWSRVQRLYETYGNTPLWLEKDADSRRADQLIDALATVHEHGLRGFAYPLDQLADALKPIDKARRPTPQQLAEADVMLTATYVSLGEDLLIGQVDPAAVAQDWRIRPQTADVDSVLARTLRSEPLAKAIGRMRPQEGDYGELQEQLRHYRAIADLGGWGRVPEGPRLRPGDSASVERLAALRNRLAAEGYMDRRADSAAAGGQGVYDRELAGAVAEFQARHGIVRDSILGPMTVAAMNVPVERRVGQIMANLERYRWLPRSLGDRYIYVNIPAFRLDAYDDGKKVLSMKVIVGEEYEDRMTPAFADSMRYI